MPRNAGTPNRKAGIFIIAALIQPPPRQIRGRLFLIGAVRREETAGQGMGKNGGARAPRPTVYGEAKDLPESSGSRSGPGCVF